VLLLVRLAVQGKAETHLSVHNLCTAAMVGFCCSVASVRGVGFESFCLSMSIHDRPAATLLAQALQLRVKGLLADVVKASMHALFASGARR
jgi:hypothetical protein